MNLCFVFNISKDSSSSKQEDEEIWTDLSKMQLQNLANSLTN